ncbi:glucose 1-dehydrogenase [Ktedonosporobacter rubrisoli]|uniref:Glucose 1-dehydrogenase n=1 Tax=Ktedonosporobacter rubrisoli TaxID=2509675 RepID=A0A4P6JM51_KTERU|nr:glucose 1-dehydrogenase [Ktedonosporobacter rubrisoli]QBD76120.1 glucose 1-dehydrogenase [Ktedonosporobacter rubrisoli]
MRLANKVAIITGSASGMGQVAAELFAQEGACVVVTDTNAQAGEAVTDAIRQAGGSAIFARANVASEADVKTLVQTAVDTYGHIDVLYNNAGIMPPEDRSVTETSEDTWERVLDINLKSAYLCTRYVIPHMLEHKQGSIINVASFVAFIGCSVPQDAYTASKGGMLSLTKSLAVQYGRYGIRCNAICPGPIETPLLRRLWTSEEARNLRLNRIPLGRFGEARDIAYMALYLASDESSWTTGAWLQVDGGVTSHYF